jgi:hypothetical protein
MMASESPGILTTTLSTTIWNRDLADLRYQRLQCAPCIVNQSSLVAHVTPGPPSAAAAEAALCGAAAPAEPGPQPPERRSGRLGRRSGGRSRRSGYQRNAGACDSSRQELTGAKFEMMIWTRISRSCLGLLQSKTMSNINEEK